MAFNVEGLPSPVEPEGQWGVKCTCGSVCHMCAQRQSHSSLEQAGRPCAPCPPPPPPAPRRQKLLGCNFQLVDTPLSD